MHKESSNQPIVNGSAVSDAKIPHFSKEQFSAAQNRLLLHQQSSLKFKASLSSAHEVTLSGDYSMGRISHIRSRSNRPIYAMCLPPKDLNVLSEFYDAGIDEVGFNLELFDREIAAKIMPAKGAIPISTYELAYKKAVSLWGRTGAVRSLLVLGLEPIESFYAGVEWLCQLGVMPIVSVFRPMDSIVLKDALPPDNQELKNIFNKATSIASKYGLTLGPSCIACQNNTLSFPL